MNSGSDDESSKGIRYLMSILGMAIIVVSMVASVQADGSIVPNIMMLVGLGIVLFAVQASVNEGSNH